MFTHFNYFGAVDYFELGVAEALGARDFVMAQAGTIIHQTSHASEVLYYSAMAEFAALVKRAINCEPTKTP